MADERKISELTKVTTLNDDDELVFVKYTPIVPATLVLQPFENFEPVGGPVVGMPTATVTSWTTLDQVVRISTQSMIMITQNWGLVAGLPPMWRYMFQAWQTNIPGFNGSENPVIQTTNLELGRPYTAKPIYTKTQIN